MKKIFLKNKNNIQFLIIGLGLIGGSVAKRLSKNGFEVLAIDKNKSHLKHAKKSKIIIISHIGRPKGEWNDIFSMKPVCEYINKFSIS